MVYTYDDIITTKDIATGKVKKEDIIGKQGWFGDTLDDMLVIAGTGFETKELRDVDTTQFYFNDKSGSYFFLPKKETEKKYVPFDLSNEEDRAKLRGAWVRPKDCYPNVDHLIRGISNITVWFGDSYLTAPELLNEYEFIDGSPCGKLVEGE